MFAEKVSGIAAAAIRLSTKVFTYIGVSKEMQAS